MKANKASKPSKPMKYPKDIRIESTISHPHLILGESKVKVLWKTTVNCEADEALILNTIPIDDDNMQILHNRLEEAREKLKFAVRNYDKYGKISGYNYIINEFLKPIPQHNAVSPELQSVENMFRIEFVAYVLALLFDYGLGHKQAKLYMLH